MTSSSHDVPDLFVIASFRLIQYTQENILLNDIPREISLYLKRVVEYVFVRGDM